MNLDDVCVQLDKESDGVMDISECTKKILLLLAEQDLIEEGTCELIDG
jgi:hypothetical protein